MNNRTQFVFTVRPNHVQVNYGAVDFYVLQEQICHMFLVTFFNIF